MATPSSRRREGRNAFCPGEDPESCCPYTFKGVGKKQDWMDGWKEEEQSYIQGELEKEEDNCNWQNLSFSCPWENNDICGGNGSRCSKENCAPYHFK